nr:hypothetical protein [Sphingomonas elodea]
MQAVARDRAACRRRLHAAQPAALLQPRYVAQRELAVACEGIDAVGGLAGGRNQLGQASGRTRFGDQICRLACLPSGGEQRVEPAGPGRFGKGLADRACARRQIQRLAGLRDRRELGDGDDHGGNLEGRAAGDLAPPFGFGGRPPGGCGGMIGLQAVPVRGDPALHVVAELRRIPRDLAHIAGDGAADGCAPIGHAAGIGCPGRHLAQYPEPLHALHQPPGKADITGGFRKASGPFFDERLAAFEDALSHAGLERCDGAGIFEDALEALSPVRAGSGARVAQSRG